MSSISQLSEKKISPENFRDLYAELHKIATSNINLQKIENDVKTLIESIIEYLIDGDKNDPTIFDIFCEILKNFEYNFVDTIEENFFMIVKKDVEFGNGNGLNIYSYECKTYN